MLPSFRLGSRRDLAVIVAASTTGGVAGWFFAAPWGVASLIAVAAVAGMLWARRPAVRPVPGWSVVWFIGAAGATGALTAQRSLEGAVTASVAALSVGLAATATAAVGAVRRHRAAHRRRGWELAHAVAAEQAARTEAAVVRERAAMAGEIHDGLGHQLTLIAVRLGRLSVDPAVPAAVSGTVEAIRGDVADAAAHLGETVQLLRDPGAPVTVPSRTGSVADVLEGAVRSGMDVRASVPDDLDGRLGGHARAALVRVLTEALTNAAKHAPGRTVYVDAAVDHGHVVMTVRNQVGTTSPAPPSSRQGLDSLRRRLAVLSGSLQVRHGEDFVLVARIGVTAKPAPVVEPTGWDVPNVVDGPGPGSDQVPEAGLREARSCPPGRRPARHRLHRDDLAADEAAWSERALRASRRAWLVPVSMAAAIAAVVTGFFGYATIASVLTPAEFAKIRAGMPETEVERVLPSVEMLDAPRDVLPEPDGAACRYYESDVSFFDRKDTYRVCFRTGVVVSTDTIPAP